VGGRVVAQPLRNPIEWPTARVGKGCGLRKGDRLQRFYSTYVKSSASQRESPQFFAADTEKFDFLQKMTPDQFSEGLLWRKFTQPD
jgi:hypothetical protein